MKTPSQKDKYQRKKQATSKGIRDLKAFVAETIATHAPDKDAEHPAFSFQHINQSNWSAATTEDRLALLDTFSRLSQVSWKDIHTLHRHKLGFETIPRRDVAFSIPPAVPSDARLMAFRFNGMKPVIGFREGGVFYVLWLDVDYSAYEHGT